MMPWQNKKTEYEVLKHLGNGAFGDISKIKRLSDGEVSILCLRTLGPSSS